MKSIVGVILVMVILLAGCSRSVDSRLVRVSELADCNATDSALAVLADVCRDSLNEHNRYYYDLMSIKARDKAYLDITADTTITDIIAYFERHGSENELGEAYYYGGRVSREQGDAPQALDYFQKSLDALTSPEHMYRKGKIASQMGQIFLELYMFEHAKPKFQEAIAYQTACADSVGLFYNNRILGETYKWLNQIDSAIYYTQKSLSFAISQKKGIEDIIECKSLLIDCYLASEEYKLAQDEFTEIEPFLNESYISNSILATAVNVYLHNNDLHNAENISKRLINSGTLYGKRFGYSVLLDFEDIKSDNKINKKEYFYDYKKALDSLNAETSRNAVIYQNSFFNYTLRERENLLLKNKHKRLKNIIILTIPFILMVVLLLLWIKERNKSLKRQLAIQILKIKQLEGLVKGENHRNTEGNPIKAESRSVEELRKDLRSHYLELTRHIDLKKYLVSENILCSEIYAKIIECLMKDNNALTDDDWCELDHLINQEYPRFKNNLFLMYDSLSEQEYKICMLVKCKIGNTKISKLLNRDKTSVSVARKRLYEKMFCENGTAADMDKFICSL